MDNLSLKLEELKNKVEKTHADLVSCIILEELVQTGKCHKYYVVERIKIIMSGTELHTKTIICNRSFCNKGNQNVHSGAKKVFTDSMRGLRKIFNIEKDGNIKYIGGNYYNAKKISYNNLMLKILSGSKWLPKRDLEKIFLESVLEEDAILVCKNITNITKEDLELCKIKLFNQTISLLKNKNKIETEKDLIRRISNKRTSDHGISYNKTTKRWEAYFYNKATREKSSIGSFKSYYEAKKARNNEIDKIKLTQAMN